MDIFVFESAWPWSKFLNKCAVSRKFISWKNPHLHFRQYCVSDKRQRKQLSSDEDNTQPYLWILSFSSFIWKKADLRHKEFKTW